MVRRDGIEKCDGFTLIELLVVIAIIALLLSILMPALSKVKEQARLIVCASHLHNAGVAVYSYAADFDGHIPPIWDYDSESPTGYKPGTSMGPGASAPQSMTQLVSEPYGVYPTAGYLPDAEMFICPADNRDNRPKFPKEREKGYFFHVYGSAGWVMSYWYFYFTPLDLTEPELATIHRYKVDKSSGKAVILADQCIVWDTPLGVDYRYEQYHLYGINTLHLGGHVNFVDGSLLEYKVAVERAKAKWQSKGSAWNGIPRLVVLDNWD